MFDKPCTDQRFAFLVRGPSRKDKMGISSQVYPGLSNKIVEVGKSASVPYLLIRDGTIWRKLGCATKSSCKTNAC